MVMVELKTKAMQEIYIAQDEDNATEIEWHVMDYSLIQRLNKHVFLDE